MTSNAVSSPTPPPHWMKMLFKAFGEETPSVLSSLPSATRMASQGERGVVGDLLLLLSPSG